MVGVNGVATPTGSVSMYVNGNGWGSPTLSGGSTSLTGFNGQPVGSYNVTGTYNSDGNYNSVSLSSTTVRIQQASPSISLSANTSIQTFSWPQSFVFTATVSGGDSPTGTVAYQVDGVTFATVALSGASAVYNGSNEYWAAGSHTITAVYSGDGNNNGTRAPTPTTINKATPSGSITCSPNPITVGTQTSTCTATMTGVSSGATPTGSVSMSSYGSVWSPTLSGGSASFTGFNGQPVGSDNVTGTYNGDGNYNSVSLSSATVTIQVASPSISLSANTSTQTFSWPQSFVFTATVSGGDSPTGTVTYQEDGTPFATVTLSSGSAVYNGSNEYWAAGSHTITAVYSGDGSNNGIRTSTPITISKATPSGSISCSPNPITVGTQTSTCTATMTASGGATPTGSVSVSSYGNAWSPTLSGGSASFTGFGGQPVGSYSVTGTYSGDGNFTSVSLSSATVTIQTVSPSISLSCNPDPVTYGANATCTATVSGDSPTGTITWTANGSSWTSTMLSGGATQATGLSGLAPGTYPVVASYSGDSNNSSSNASTTITISKATPSGSITCSPNLITVGTQTSTCTAAMSGVSGGAAPTGSVSMSSYGNAWSPILSGGSTSFTGFNGQPIGSYSVTGTYNGDTNYNGVNLSSTTVGIQAAAPSISLSANTSTQTFSWPQSFIFTATVSGGDSPTGTVTYQVDGTPFATLTLSSGSTVYNGSNEYWVAGNHTITAIYSGDGDNNGSSTTIPITVNAQAKKADYGTITLTVNNVVAATTHYDIGATPTTIAAGLANGLVSGAPITAVAVDDTLYLQATQANSATNYGYSLQTTSYDSSDFSQPSFVYPAISGNLDGGSDANTSGQAQTIYNYAVNYDYVSNVSSYTDSVMGAWNFSYDTLNRLSTAQNTATTPTSAQYANNWGCWSYDAFGNRLSQSMSTTACSNGPTPSSWAQYNGTVNGTNNNQMSATSQNVNQANGYDLAGDVTNDGTNQYLYDGEGRICAVASTPIAGMTAMTGYIYDASGTRVAKGTITAWSCDPGASGFKTLNDYILGPGGEQVTEMGMGANGAMAWQHTNVWAGGELVATYDTDGLHFYLDDALGTRRAQTDYAGVLEQTCTNLPFGDSLGCTGSLTTPTEHHFTGKERDAESGNDYFGARYYASSMGRFLSPDWSATVEPVPYAKFGDPQSLNLYAYVGNNPLSRIDADGHSDSFNSDFRKWLCLHEGECGGASDDAHQPIEAQQQSQPPPTGKDGKPTPPPVAVPGCPTCGWVWNPDKQNPRGGTWGPSGWKGANPPKGSWDPDGHWDVDPGGKGPRGRYTPDGTPITPGQAHPGNTQSPMDSVSDWVKGFMHDLRQYLNDHPYGPNSSPGPYVPPPFPMPVPVIP
jgi:RHS repeat-associated protein